MCVGRCVCAAPGLRLPAVPEGPTDPAGVPDSVLPGSLSGSRSRFPLRHLPDVHRCDQLTDRLCGEIDV